MFCGSRLALVTGKLYGGLVGSFVFFFVLVFDLDKSYREGNRKKKKEISWCTWSLSESMDY